MAQKPWIVPIPGTCKLSRLGENIEAVAVKLTSDDLREIESAASKITVQGARLAPSPIAISSKVLFSIMSMSFYLFSYVGKSIFPEESVVNVGHVTITKSVFSFTLYSQ